MENPHRFAVMAYRYSCETRTIYEIIDGTFLSGDYLIAQEEPDVRYTQDRGH